MFLLSRANIPMSLKLLTPDTCVVRGTHTRKGRSLFVSPETTSSRWLRYGRINLSPGDQPVRFQTEACETAFVGLGGEATVRSAGQQWTVRKYDALYVPKGSAVEVLAGAEGCDVAELAAPVDGVYAPAFVAYEDVKADPSLHFRTGGPNSSRELNILIGKNVEAGRLLAGVTFSDPGHWTSWPPHEHADMLEEIYLYIDMPAPAFGVQFVYTDRQSPEIATFVRDGDCVIIPRGYHPNVAAPGSRIGFLWFMAAHREVVDRQFGVVNVQPEFATAPSGLEAARK
jgi:5-deoxy-glucuronate isomerase